MRNMAVIDAPMSQQYIEAQIELAITFARLVLTERAFGQTVLASDIAQKAFQMHAEAEQRLREIKGRGWDKLRSRLAVLKGELDMLDHQPRKAA